MKIAKTLISVFVVTALIGAVYGTRTVKNKAVSSGTASIAAPKMAGNASAATRVVEFIDYQCPSCGKSAYFLHELMKLHPQDLFVEVKYFPLKGHAHSMTSAKAVECARMQGKFWEAHHAVFLAQPQWRDLTDAKPLIHDAIRAAGADMAALDRCEADPAVEARIYAEREEGVALGLKSTPTFYINGKMAVGFAAMSEELSKVFPDAASIVLPPDNLAAPFAAPAAEAVPAASNGS